MRWTLLFVMLMSGSVFAEEGRVLIANQSVELNASVDKVWQRVGNFADASWNSRVSGTVLLSGDGKAADSQRLIKLKDGGELIESLMHVYTDYRGFACSYRIDDGVLPVSSFTSDVIVRHTGRGGSRVMWAARFQPKGDASGSSKAAAQSAQSAVDAYIAAGLEGLKAEFGVLKN